ncbi:MAG: VanW family protein [Terrisporobacter sp.]|uniref:VanW family protein n=1 Tax=Terrisporobacter sp. TaxID=1965305 RepID=UPI002A833780|nr:VanW family protein [Terrisporobacter sp.]MCI6457843.1 VanW family protein [Clostridium sp.]MCI7205196.1 VanW family protein [Clostridium sp.]MDY4735418.1 VanW family protein [Terrisporobacter sp.]MDY6152342.1 VanW family protein [Terrisporobacter sp.]
MKKLKIAILLSLLIVSFDNVVLSNAVGFEGKIHKNIYVRDIDISNLTREEAKNKINKIIESNNSFILNLSENKYVFLKEDIDVDYNVDDLIETAYGIGRNEGIISNIKTIGNLRLGKKIILDYRITYDEKKLNKYLMELNKKIYKKPKNATIRINNGQIIITKEKNGYKLNKDKLKNTLVEKIVNMDCSEEIIPIITIKPVYLYEDLSKIDTVLGRFETYFNSQNYNRSTNIKLAASATTNILLNQGEVFSFNSNIQNSNISKYLKEAPVIINGKSEKGRGGGMCQVSSTIYNAALYSGMSIISVRNHSIPSPYIEKGRDATVSGGIIDLKFKNNYKTPVYIYNQVMGNKIVCTIYGNKRDKQDIEIITEITDEINNRIIRKNSEKYDLGVKTIEQEGRKGYKVKTYRVYKNDFGNKSEYIGESYYPPQDKIIIYGTRELRK